MAASNLMCSLAGKVALITGASSGIGAATAVLFARLGARLSLTGRNAENLKRVSDNCVAQLPPGSERPLLVISDLAVEGDVQKMVEETVRKYGRLDILVNNAGIMELGSIESTSLEQYDRIMSVNVRAVYQLTMLAVPHLTATKGSIVNVSSVCGTRSFPNVLAYCISKSAVDQLTSCVALELATKGVRVNSVNPGVILTELQQRGGMSDEAYAAFIAGAKNAHPLGRPGQPEEVAKAIAFLASGDSSFTTGIQLPVDGGRHAACPR